MMGKVFGTVLCAGMLLSLGVALPVSAAEFPSWAYPDRASPAQPAPPDGGPLITVPDSDAAFTLAQIRDPDNIADWHPNDHSAMPEIVAKGDPLRRQGIRGACGFCHTPSGAGRPENAAISGLAPAYFKQQIINFRNGDRQGSASYREPQNYMIQFAQVITNAEIEEAAAYFASIEPTSFVTVIESETAPKTISPGFFLALDPAGGSEPLGRRIIEVPDDLERFEHRDPRTTFTAYVPMGSLARGEELVSGGGAKTIACAICHGEGLKGLGDVPHIAGRSPSYIMRQLYDMKTGTRAGSAQLMAQVVANLELDDMIAITAYVASLD
jgi:cytochrome c553